ncbi:MAG: glycosyltransferase family 4 protein [Hyphomicrobiaceae bacterium]
MARRFRIIHCLRAPVGGLFRHVRDLAMAQASRGHAVGVVCDSSAKDPLTESHLAALAPHLSLGLHQVAMSRDIGPSDLRATRCVSDLAATHAADILHGHGAKGGAYARFAGQKLARSGRPVGVFYTPHGGSLHYDPASLVGRAYMAAERHMARLTSGIIFESAYSERVFRAKIGEPTCMRRVIHNGIQPAELEPVTTAPDAAELLFIGELRKLKGVDVLLQALAEVRRSQPCRLVIVGAGPDATEFRALAQSLGLDDAVHFAGAMPARQAFALGRALVMPSRAESFPYVALEGAGAGLPLIASDVGGVPEIVAGTDTKLVLPGDVGALSAALSDVIRDPDAARARAERLRAEVGRRFSVAAMTDGVLGFYDDAMQKAAA